MAIRLEPSWFSVQPTEATTLLLSTPDRSESHQSVALEPLQCKKNEEDWGGQPSYQIPVVIQGVDCHCPGVLFSGHVPENLMTPFGCEGVQENDELFLEYPVMEGTLPNRWGCANKSLYKTFKVCLDGSIYCKEFLSLSFHLAGFVIRQGNASTSGGSD